MAGSPTAMLWGRLPNSNVISGLQKQIMDTVTKNLEKLIYQVNVVVRNKQTDYNYELSTWLYNYGEKVDLGTFSQGRQ